MRLRFNWRTKRHRLPAWVGLMGLWIGTIGLAIACSHQPFDGAGATHRVAPAEFALGTNLNGIQDWSTQLPFIDAFKSSRAWAPECVGAVECSPAESTDASVLDLDENGWVKTLPSPEGSPPYTAVGTLMFREIQGQYPAGPYVVLYDGEGTIEYGLDAQKDESASRPGRHVIDVTPSHDGIHLMITQTDPQRTGDYIRNLHVVPLEFEETFQTEIFNPAFIEKIQPFQALRFMDWMGTNHSPHRDWADRPRVDQATYSEVGVPLELMVELANRLGVPPWFCMPHQATDDYLETFARFVQDHLDPALRVYVEFSNEVWNQQFEQAQYAINQGKTRWGEEHEDASMQWYGMRSAQMADIWKRVFADGRDRLVTVISTQTAWRGLEASILDCPLWVAEGNTPCAEHVDAYAITGYFTGNLHQAHHSATLQSWMAEPDGGFAKAIAQLQSGQLLQEDDDDDSVAGLAAVFKYHARVAQRHGLPLLAYEGGQHLVSPDDEVLTQFFVELNRRPEMYDLYTQLLTAWKEAGGSLFMNFIDISKSSRWGSWGALETVLQDGSPKYDALMDFIPQSRSDSGPLKLTELF